MSGAAWATFIGQLLNAAFFLFSITRCKTVKLEKKNFKPQGRIIGRICVLGLSSFITQFATVIVLAVVNNVLKSTGANSVYGSDIPVAAMLFFWAIIELFPTQIIGIFGEQNELYMDFARQCLQIFMGALMTAVASVVIGTFFQAIGKPAQATVLTFLRQIVLFVPTMLLLSISGDVLKVLWTGPISDGASCIISISKRELFAERLQLLQLIYVKQKKSIDNLSKKMYITPIMIIDSLSKHMQKLTDEAQVISKDDFADYVINHPDEFDFSNFQKIFDVIVSIDKDVNIQV